MKRVQPCEGKMQLPDLLWFMCCAREAETERRFKPTRHSACVSAWPVSLTCARAVSFSRRPQCAWLSPNRQILSPIAPFRSTTSLAAQRAVMQTTTNRVNCERLLVFARVVHAYMLVPLHTLHFSSSLSAQCSFHCFI